MKWMLGLLLTAGVLAGPTATLVANPTSVLTTLSTPTTIEGYCTVFESQTERITLNGVEGKYTPRHCYLSTTPLTVKVLEDDWDFIDKDGGKWLVWMEIQQANGLDDIITNQAEVTR